MLSTHRNRKTRAERNRETRENGLRYCAHEAERTARERSALAELESAISAQRAGDRGPLSALIARDGRESVAMDTALLLEQQEKKVHWVVVYDKLVELGF